MENTLSLEFYDFCNFYKEPTLEAIANLAQSEPWGFDEDDKYSILLNYLKNTYKKLAELYNNASTLEEKNKWIYITDDSACFNTGLFNNQYNQIYLYFIPNNSTNPKYQHKKWYCAGPKVDSDMCLTIFNPLPSRAKYISSVEDLVYDTNLELRVNKSHILEDERNLERIPEQFRDSSTLNSLLDGAIETAKKKIAANYKIAVPQYYQSKMQLLIPLCIVDRKNVDLVLAVSKSNDVYIGHTALTKNQAYNNARLIIKPDVDWLKLNK